MVPRKSSKRNDEERIVLTSCTHDCGSRCLLKVHVKDGVIVRIESDDGKDPELRACARGRAYRQKEYAPDRLKFPMKRIGARGEGKFERISWDEALDIVASELKRVKATYGSSAILCIGIDGSWGQLHTRLAARRLLNLFGGFVTHLENVSCHGMVVAANATFGIVRLANTPDDYLNSRLIIIWGWNPAANRWQLSTVHSLWRAKDTRTKLVCVDPRCTDTAAILANQWIPIRPGTDTAMLIAMAYVIIVEGLQDQAFIDKYTVGFDQYKDYVLGVEDGIAKTPVWAEAITGVPAATITNLARDYANLKPAALTTGWGPGRTAYGEQFHRAAMVLASMTGNIGIHGGHPGYLSPIDYPPAPYPFGSLPVGDNPVLLEAPIDKDRLPWPTDHRSVASINSNKLFDAILQGKAGGYYSDIKLAYITHANPINSLVNSNKGIQAFQKLEFIVVHEQFMTATARLADIVLPVNSQLERCDIANAWMGSPPWLFYLNKVVDSAYECKTDLEICTELAARLGITNYSDKTEDEWLREIAGSFEAITDYDEFRRKVVLKVELPEPIVPLKEQIEDPENNPFPTPSGKIEIYSQQLADMNNPKLPPIPKYIEDWEGPHHPLVKKYPLQVISFHAKTRVHSQFDTIPWLRELEPHKVWINSVDARARGISDGDLVSIFNDRGKMLITCRVTERIMPGVICMAEGAPFSPDENGVDRGGCENTIANDVSSPGGASTYNAVLAQVEKA
jgi:anaerobic dimethyl sulfoxide reductase subunit A